MQTINAQDMNPKITTFLMFEGDAEEAITFYTSLFDDSEIVRIAKYGPDGQFGPDAEGTVQHALFTLKGQPYIAIDSYGHDFTFTPAISLFVECDSEEEIDKLYEKLSDGGEVAMPLNNYGFSTKFGWVQDRFGVSWQLNYGALEFE
ncbi:VOC family protein [Rhodohalobacter sp. SW132]|nr:VOC family protein [Rhodohalobacter sp. SW132]